MRACLVAVMFTVMAGLTGCAAEGASATAAELSPSCDAVRCPMPLCVQGQHLSYQGSCCPTCVGPNSHADRCAGIACPMLLCAIGMEYVTHGNDCCGRCEPIHQVQECATDLDCPQLECFACPCPTTSCRGHQCVTSTPDASSCGI